MSPNTVSRLLFALAIAGAIAAPAPAAAQGLRVAPSSIDQRVRAGTLVGPVTLRNDSDRTVVVEAFALRAGQELNGLPQWTVDSRSRRIGRRFVRVSPARFRVAPGGARTVRGRVIARRPARGNGGYGVVIFDVRLAGGSARGDAVVGANVRLAANLLLRYPGPVRHDTVLEQARAEQAGPRVLRFFARMRNRGNLHLEPTARMVIRDSRGRAVARAGFVSGNVLPLARRELTADLTKVLPAGRYVAHITTRAARRTTRKRLPFTLVGPNALPTARLEVSELRPPQAGIDEDFDVTVGLVNRGTAAARPRGLMTLSRLDGRPIARRSLRFDVLGPRQRTRSTTTFPGVGEGQYRLSVRVEAPGGANERTVVFAPGEQPSLLSRILDWAAAHVALLIAVFGAILLATIIAAGTYIRRLRRAAAQAGG